MDSKLNERSFKVNAKFGRLPDAVAFHFGEQCFAVQPQPGRYLAAMPGVLLQGLQDELLFMVRYHAFEVLHLILAVAHGGASGCGRRRRQPHPQFQNLQGAEADNDILQFAHIARPIVLSQHFHHFFGDRRQALFAAVKVEEMLDEQGQILFAFAQGGQLYGQDVDAIEKVLAEKPFGDALP